VAEALARAGNPGRSGHALSLRSARDLFEARERLCALFRGGDSARFAFMPNATAALNTAIKGLLRRGDHVVTTSVEHNSVMRPLRRMEEEGVRVTIVPADPATGRVEARTFCAAFRRSTRLAVVVHASNVSGAIQPVEEIAAAARARGIYTLVDAAQTAGSIPVDLSALPVDLLAAPGHKGLLGPQGTGFLFVREGVPLRPLLEGGTGSRSEWDAQPDFYPDRLESGTQNSVGIAGLAAALAWLLRRGVEAVRRKERALLDELLAGLRGMPGVVLYGPADSASRVGVVSFNVEGVDPAAVARRLEERWRILVRAGLHCAPHAHRTLSTFPEGTVRASLGPFNDPGDVALLLEAVWAIARPRRAPRGERPRTNGPPAR